MGPAVPGLKNLGAGTSVFAVYMGTIFATSRALSTTVRTGKRTNEVCMEAGLG